jgi:uncharacterized membrane protein YeaQ/YmgE (transglycosylase-associated protein family)
VKTVVLFMLIGALIGIAVASFVVPPMLAWYAEPGGPHAGEKVQAICDLAETIRSATHRLMMSQLVAGIIGAIVFLFPGLAVERRRGRNAAAEVAR